MWNNPARGATADIRANDPHGLLAAEGRSFIERDAGRQGVDPARTTVDMAAIQITGAAGDVVTGFRDRADRNTGNGVPPDTMRCD